MKDILEILLKIAALIGIVFGIASFIDTNFAKRADYDRLVLEVKELRNKPVPADVIHAGDRINLGFYAINGGNKTNGFITVIAPPSTGTDTRIQVSTSPAELETFTIRKQP